MVKIQIISDTHLEFRGDNFKKIVKVSAPILFLLGDICACGSDSDFETYKNFINYLAPKFEHIFHVSGNHEYYTAGNKAIGLSDTIPGIDAKIRKFLKTFSNVYFLNNNTMRLEIDAKNYVFIGSTLWSNVSPESRKQVQARMNDYSQIYMPEADYKKDKTKNQVRKYNIDDMSNFHKKSVRYIKKEMKKIGPNDIGILLTHHKPVRDKDPKEIITQAYETDLVNIIIKPPIKLAAHGHTHERYDKVVNNVRIVSNPKGYIREHTKYDNTFTVTV
jgi:predicted phosphodiesterase